MVHLEHIGSMAEGSTPCHHQIHLCCSTEGVDKKRHLAPMWQVQVRKQGAAFLLAACSACYGVQHLFDLMGA